MNSNGTAARQPAGRVAGPTAGSESTHRAQCCASHAGGASAPATGSRPGTGLQVPARRRQSVSHRPLAMLGRGQSRPGPGLGPASAAASSVGPIPRARASATVLITASNGSSCSGAIGRGPRAVTIGSELSAWYGPAGLCCRAAEWPPRPRPPLTVT